MSKQFIRKIRDFEAQNGLKPADIKILASGEITVTIDKSVLYQYEPGENSVFSSFFSWLNDSDNHFSPTAHAQRLALQVDTGVQVSVKKRYKQLPLPYFSIPIPIENAGTKVRDYDNLAVQKVKVSLTFPANCSSQNAILNLLTVASLSEGEQLPSAARRVSRNPIKWTLHLLSMLVPRSVAQVCNKVLPNKWIKATRPLEWGTLNCNETIDHGYINSGFVASLVNLTVVTPLTVGMGNTLSRESMRGDCPFMGDVCGTNKIYNSMADDGDDPWGPTSKETNSVYSQRFSLFMQTRAKLDYSSPYTQLCNSNGEGLETQPLLTPGN